MWKRNSGYLTVLVCLVLAGCSEETKQARDSVAGDLEKTSAAAGTYKSQEDPDAFYTLDDVEMVGSYVKLDFRDLSDDQVNRVIHRLRTELSGCNSGRTIDECLVTRPACVAAQQGAKEVIREEREKG